MQNTIAHRNSMSIQTAIIILIIFSAKNQVLIALTAAAIICHQTGNLMQTLSHHPPNCSFTPPARTSVSCVIPNSQLGSTFLFCRLVFHSQLAHGSPTGETLCKYFFNKSLLIQNFLSFFRNHLGVHKCEGALPKDCRMLRHAGHRCKS